jgi:cholesterol transport system auxiliary component
MTRWIRLASVLALLGGCAAISAGRPLDTYELRPLPATGGARGSQYMVVEVPTASGTLATDRIAIKANAFEVAYLPGVRWTNEAPVLVQLLLMRSLEGTGAFGLVSASPGQAEPDWFLETDLQAFQVEVDASGAVYATVGLRAALISDADRSIRSARSFQKTVPAASTGVTAVVPALDSAMTAVLRDLTSWTAASVR